MTLGTWSYTAQDSKVADTGQYLTVWHLNEAGAWRIVLDQSHQPANAACRAGANARCL